MIENNTQGTENTLTPLENQPKTGGLWDFLTRPSSALTNIEARRTAQLLAGLTLVTVLVVLSGLFSSLAMNGANQKVSDTIAFIGIISFTAAAYFFSRTRYYMAGTWIVLAAFSLLSYSDAITSGIGDIGFPLTFLSIAFIMGSVLLPLRGIIILAVFNFIFIIILSIMGKFVGSSSMMLSGVVVSYGVLLFVFYRFRQGLEQLRLAETQRMNRDLQALSTSLEQGVAERTRDILVAVEVGRTISAYQNKDELLSRAVEFIRERFDLYYTQVYLVSLNGNSLLLRAGTGPVGAELLNRGHRLPVDYTSINGTAAEERRAVVVGDTAASKIFRPHPLLPQTRSEMSVPIIAGDRLLGVLDLQSSEVNALSDKNIPVFEVMAGQLATALVNADLFERLENTLTEVESHNRQRVRQSWDSYLDAIHIKDRIGYTYDQLEIKPLQQPLADMPEASVLSAPIAIAGEKLGSFQFVSDHPWAPENTELVQTVAAQVAQQIENLRLLNQAEWYRAESEEAVRRLTRQEWGEFVKSAGTGETAFIYEQDEVRPLSGEQGSSNPALKFDIRIRDEEIGHFGFEGDAQLSPEDNELVAAISEQLGAHLENIRLVTTAQQELEERRKAEAIIAKRAAELTTVSEVATVVATIQSPEEMLQTVVDLTKVSFELYHAHIYLLDPDIQMLVLTKGAGEVGRQMVAEGRRIPFQAEKSLVARAARTRQGVISNNVRQDPDFLPHPLLPETQSEMAVPMIVGDTLLGVLDIQSDQVGHFSEEDISIHTTLAAQVAVALQNARQYAQTQESERLTRTVIDSTPDWIFIKDRQFRFRLVNQGYLNSMHWEMEDVIGKDDIELGFPEELVKGDPENGIAGFWADDRAVMESGVPKVVPKDIVVIDGKERILNTLKTPLRDASGYVWGVLAFCRDVTEREQTLADAEALYEGSRQLSRSQTYHDVLQAVVKHTVLNNFDAATINLFDRPWEEGPNTIEVLAVHRKEGAFLPFKEGMVLPAQSFTNFYRGPKIEEMIIENTAADPRLTEDVRSMMLNQQGVQASIIWPLLIGGQVLGMVSATSAQPIEVNETEKRRLGSLLDQASTMMQSLRLLDAAQSRAQRERALREITARVRNSMDPDTILRTAVRELGAALGRPAFVRVGSADQLLQKENGEERDAGQDAGPLAAGSGNAAQGNGASNGSAEGGR